MARLQAELDRILHDFPRAIYDLPGLYAAAWRHAPQSFHRQYDLNKDRVFVSALVNARILGRLPESHAKVDLWKKRACRESEDAEIAAHEAIAAHERTIRGIAREILRTLGPDDRTLVMLTMRNRRDRVRELRLDIKYKALIAKLKRVPI